MTPRKSLSKITIEENTAAAELNGPQSVIKSARQNDSSKQKEAEFNGDYQGFQSASLNGSVKLISVKSNKKLNDTKEAFIDESNESASQIKNDLKDDSSPKNTGYIDSKTYSSKTNDSIDTNGIQNDNGSNDQKTTTRYSADQLTKNGFYNENIGEPLKASTYINEQNGAAEQQEYTSIKKGKEGNQSGILKVKEEDQSYSTEGTDLSSKSNSSRSDNVVKKERSYTELLRNKYKGEILALNLRVKFNNSIKNLQ